MLSSNPFLAAPSSPRNGPLDYKRAPQPLVFTNKREFNLEKLVESIFTNETKATVKEPYTFAKFSGDKTLGRDLGKYQITEGELASYAKRFLGRVVSAAEFLASPALQEQYIRAKAKSLFDRGLTVQEILASHRGGMSDLTREGLDKKLKERAGYVQNGMKTYLGGLAMGNVEMPSQAQKPVFQHNPFLNDQAQSRALIGTVFPAASVNSFDEYKQQTAARNQQITSPEGVLGLLPGGEAGGAIAGSIKKVAGKIPEALEALAAEARKYKSADDFVKNRSLATDLKITRQAGADQLLKYKQNGLEEMIDEDGFITLYHGGKFKGNAIKASDDEIFFLTPNKEEALDYARKNKGTVTAIKTRPEYLNYNTGSNEWEISTIMQKVRDPDSLEEIFAPTPSKSQLTDFYNQVTKGADEPIKREAQAFLQKLKEVSPNQPEAWYQGQLAMQPFMKTPEKFGFINTAPTGIAPEVAADTALVPPKPPVSPPLGGTASSPIVPNDPVQKLIAALKEARPIRKEQEALYSKARAQKVARLAATQGRTSGEAGFYKELGSLKGELPKVNYESIRPEFEQADIDHLFNMVKDSPRLDLFEQITARGALVKMLGGEGGAVPTVGELKLLNQVFPKELVETLLEKRPFMEKFWDGTLNALNVPRSIMASFDLSAPFRQGVFMVGRKEFFPAFAQMFKKFGSEKAFQAAQEEIASRPTFKLMKQSKLALTEMDHFLSDREEMFMSNWAEKIPVAGKIIRASGRAYVGFLNKLRADVFDSLVKEAKNTGVDLKENSKALNDLAKFINSATGRGDLGALNKAAPALNAIFFSPRLMASRLNLLNPVYYVQLDPFVRKQAIKSLLSFAGIAGTVMGLAKMGGASVSADPTNADFAKVKVDNTRYDVLGGFQQYIRLASQLIAGKITSSTTGKELILGEGYKPMTRLDILERFFQTKENPVASFVTNFLQGHDVLGNKFNLTNEVVNRFIPLIAQDAADALREHGAVKGTLMEIPAVFGVGTQTYGGSKTLSGPSNPFLK